jgi:O-antigen/teichoic acid export membrane protein
MLYFRQILLMLMGLYTVPLVLETLGAEDYGIYSVVGGVVTMLGFLGNSMVTTSQRYFMFEIGRGDFRQLKKVFNLNLLIYALIAVIVLVLAEIAGLWFIDNKLNIAPGREETAFVVYETSVVSFLFTILAMPYMAAIIAHEDMNIYARISFVEAILKLAVVVLLRFILFDKLQLYGILNCFVVCINSTIYLTVCHRRYKECDFKFFWDKKLFKEIANYAGWNMFAVVAGISKNQAVNVLLNQFFNPIVVAARGIALSVNNAVVDFANNFSIALRPQIIKNYASGRQDEMFRLAFFGSKITFFLMYIFILPLLLETPAVLSAWLKNIPDNAVLFVRLVLIDALIDSLGNPIRSIVRATGKIQLYQAVIGGVLFLNGPLSWMLLKNGKPAYSVMVIAIFIALTEFTVRLFILKTIVKYSITSYLRNIIFPICIVSVLSGILPLAVHCFLEQNIWRLCLVSVISTVSLCVFMYNVGFDRAERKKINRVILQRLNRLYTGSK